MGEIEFPMTDGVEMCPGNKWNAVTGTIILCQVQKVKAASLPEFVF